MGFCLFNNVAVGVAHALEHHGLARAAVVDFDVHHGNGTEDIFAGDDRVVMTGTFQYRCILFGRRAAGSEHAQRLFRPAAAAIFSQGLCRGVPARSRRIGRRSFVSAGFDAHREDPLANLQLTDDDYGWVTSRIAEVAARHAGGRIVSTLEGGYALSALGRSATAHVRALAGLGP
jgi:acetoin utilization deacetylase AcuC-like enzyme